MMQALLKRLNSKKRGFTLIELIIVIAILAILAAILVPSMLKIVSDSRERVLFTNARSVYSAAHQSYISMAAEGKAPTEDDDADFLEKITDSLGDALPTDSKIAIKLYDGDKKGVEYVVYTDANDNSAYYGPEVGEGTGAEPTTAPTTP